MAIDTKNRRASAIGNNLLWLVSMPVPNADIGDADRQHMCALYRDVTGTPPAGGAFKPPSGLALMGVGV